ncbi:MAG TPA: hypothetical protein VJ725_01275 [Thermoanaerobaculia bacterium]|nr:hypothetical protein [Thermoanaerobaculia bacterium]
MSGPETPELAAARRAREAQAALAAEGEMPRPIPPPQIRDPLPFCIWTTVAVISWIVTPAVAAAAFGIVGLRAYARAWKAGLRRSNCVLGDLRWVMLYLGIVIAAGVLWTGVKIWRLAGF